MPIPDLSSDNITAIRSRYIRDLFVPANGSTPFVALSHYNRATKSQYITDADLQATAYDVGRAYGEEIGGVYDDAFKRLTNAGDATADAQATALQLDAFFRLIRAEVFQNMMLDPGFVGSIADAAREALFDTWRKQIIKDRQFTRARTSAPYRSVPIERY